MRRACRSAGEPGRIDSWESRRSSRTGYYHRVSACFASACPRYKYSPYSHTLRALYTLYYTLYCLYRYLYLYLYLIPDIRNEAPVYKIPRQWHSPLPHRCPGLHPEQSVIVAFVFILGLSSVTSPSVVRASLSCYSVDLFLVSPTQTLYLYAFAPGRTKNRSPRCRQKPPLEPPC